VLAHEIGHAIDMKYDLKTRFLGNHTLSGELRALADLRVKPGDSAGHRKYVRKNEEKMAVMLEAFVHAPGEFERVAPRTFKAFKDFLGSQPELEQILKLTPSLTFAEHESTVKAGGIVLGGEYWAQKDLARILDNHMSKDFISGNPWGKGLMDSRNTLNAINLGLSAFHATGTTLLAMMSRMAVGISEVAHGRPLEGLGKIASAPGAPLLYVMDGWRFYRGDPELMKIERDLFTGGASLERHQYYKNRALDRFAKNMVQMAKVGTPYQRAGSFGKGLLNAPMAAIEAPMRALVEFYIPQMKVAAFRDLFSSQLRIKAKDIASGKTSQADVARIAWRDIEDRFGLVNYDNEFWHSTLKGAILVLIRAPGWSLGTVRALGGAAFADLPRFAVKAATGRPPEWTSRMSFALGMTFVTMGAGAIYHRLHTGENPETLEDLLHPKNGLLDENGKPQRVDFPTFMKDVAGWREDWVKALLGKIEHRDGTSTLFHGGKLAPEITLGMSLLDNQTYRGPMHRPIRSMDDWFPAAGDVIKYILGAEQPFSISQARQLAKRGASREQMVEAFAGIVPRRQRRKRRPRAWRNRHE
jgi:hypothetical protein